MSSAVGGNTVRVRLTAARSASARVHYAPAPPTAKPSRIFAQRLRIEQFQRRWKNIKQDLPPQLSRRHIGMISIGGVIGTGLFLGSGNALKHGGPIGALLGYFVIGTVVYCLCVSVGEMIAFLPNVGGVVGLADLYVDPALGFSLGWAAWYNWSVTLPAEITAAAVVVRFWDTENRVSTAGLSAIFLFLAVAVNCFSSRIYGEFEFWFSTIKVVTIILIIIVCLILDLGAGAEGFIGFKNWSQPFAHSYLGINGSLGQFLGFWAVLMQASFSFFGSEVPGIAAGEVIDASRNVPRALRRVWIRITLFYIGGIFVAGLLVPANDSNLGSDTRTASSSPFVIALNRAHVKILPHFINGAILLSAWSAAASDVYIGSRYPWHETPEEKEDTSDEDSEDDEPPVIDIRRQSIHESLLIQTIPASISEDQSEDDKDTRHDQSVQIEMTEASSQEIPGEPSQRQREPYLVLPLAAVLVSASVGLLSFLGSTGSSKSAGPQVAFNWLVAVASVASLQSWAGLLFTYIRWHQGTVYAEKKHKVTALHNEDSAKVIADIEQIKKQRHIGQPYLAWYAFGICMTVLLTNGWSVFVHGGWKIAETPGDDIEVDPNTREDDPVSLFLSSYIPIPFFLLLTFGYKLIHQTKMIKLEDMTFSRGDVPEHVEEEERSFLRWLLVL
ncbi:unnamed protein product [Somion occarium]|uniref:Amino acid permease/ SLC12A domain-containing protein n=1 Tax=Somion occarium TaxID=3059160 RepID=A0ABP1E2S8_9APHY